MKQIIFAAMLLTISCNIAAQDKKVIRIARISIDSSQVTAYRKLLKTQMETAVRLEPGVLSYTVYEDKTDASKITILEVYADSNAYMAHREAPHFKQYKLATKDMVKSLELSELNPVLALKKEGDFQLSREDTIVIESFSGSNIGQIAETQEMLEFCAQHNITADIELIKMQQINEAFERPEKGNVKYRFVTDMASSLD